MRIVEKSKIQTNKTLQVKRHNMLVINKSILISKIKIRRKNNKKNELVDLR